MVEGPVKISRIVSVQANAITATNILSFKDEFRMKFYPQFIPNTYPGVSIVEHEKYRVLTIVIDSESDLFDADFEVEDENTSIGTQLIVNLIADTEVNVGVAETWTYDEDNSYIQRREFGRIEDGAPRNTIEYVVVTWNGRAIT